MRKGVIILFKSRWLHISLILSLLLVASAALVSAQTANYTHIVAKVTGAPQIDGLLNDATWLQASQQGSKIVVDIHSGGSNITQYPRVGYLAYDETALYVAVVAYEPNVDSLVTNPTSPWSADEIEIFLQAGDDPGFHQIVITSAGDHAHLTPRGTVTAPHLEYEFATNVSDINWTIEVAIPFESLGHQPEAGDEWKLNLNGNQFSNGGGYIAWNPTYGSFQNAARFATIVFGD